MLETLALDPVIFIALLGAIAYFTSGTFWGIPKDPESWSATVNPDRNGSKVRDIVEEMAKTGKRCAILYGSQTGTAENYASRLAKEASQRFGLEAMVADMEEYDYGNLHRLSPDKVAFFIMATYGEGEPTDNAMGFFEFITSPDVAFENGPMHSSPLSSLNYVTFGLGNSTYEHYNATIRRIGSALANLGAKRIGEAGEGDDGAGNLEEDFLAWKEPMWQAVSTAMGLQEQHAVYQPAFEISEDEGKPMEEDTVYLGELSRAHLENRLELPYSAQNPFITQIDESKELFTVQGRNCLHMEINIAGSNMCYQAGDHIAIYPTNPESEVNRFLKVFGLEEKRQRAIAVTGVTATGKVPIPSPTTYDAVARHYLEVCGPVSRQFISTLATFAPDEEARAEMERLGNEKDYFYKKVTGPHFNLAQTLGNLTCKPFATVPFSLLLEGLNKLKPRYYSISSSSLVQQDKASITVAVESSHFRKGVATNYLLALKQKQNNDQVPEAQNVVYSITGPRRKYDGIRIPVYIRHSTFRLPFTPSRPIIMVGPGTGVAPFRGFIHERASLASRGERIGAMLLFFGCGTGEEDFIYKDEWESYKSLLGDCFKVITAFSREGAQKVYVQHRLKEHARLVSDLLGQGANFYVCGDAANMARDISSTLTSIVAEQSGVCLEKGEETIREMRATGRYQEDVW